MDVYLVWREVRHEDPTLLAVEATLQDAFARARATGLPYGNASRSVPESVCVEQWTVGSGYQASVEIPEPA